MGLWLRRRQRRGPCRHAQPAGRQGRQSGRDEQSRPARAAGLHHHHRGLHPLLRQRQDLSRRAEDAGRGGARGARAADRRALRRCRRSASGLGALGRARLDAGHDGHGAQSRPQRPHRRRPRAQERRRALRLRQLSPLHPDVRPGRARRRASPFRGGAGESQARSRRDASTPSFRPPTGRMSSPPTRTSSSASAASPSRRIPRRSSGARSARCSARG